MTAREQLKELQLRDGPGQCWGATQLAERLLDAIEAVIKTPRDDEEHCACVPWIKERLLRAVEGHE